MNHPYLVGFDLEKTKVLRTDVLVIGEGIAGLTAAIIVAGKLDVCVLAKSGIKQTSTWHAQGGIAVPLAANDSPDLHISDTLEAGAGLCDREAVEVLVREAEPAISMLLDLGTGFDRHDGILDLGREGGHSVSRVVHAGDATGAVIAEALSKAVKNNPRISINRDAFVLDLLVADNECYGVLAYDEKNKETFAYIAGAVVLAAGGMGQIYEATTNPLAATGDGQAMAARKKIKLSDLEFVQFHPTAFASDSNPRFLISEALRGEGAHLLDGAGRRFMLDKHPMAELAPRDMVCRAVIEVMQKEGTDHVDLDARHIPAEAMKVRFPAITKYCREHGLDTAKDLIPVCPAAHYLIGGVKTDLYGRTSMDRLYAGGEVASTGVHGANRLASNSLLEGLVFSKRIGEVLLQTVESGEAAALNPAISAPHRPAGRSLETARAQLRRLMSQDAGAVRTIDGLQNAAKELAEWSSLLDYEYGDPGDWETANMLTMATMIVNAALARKRSLGVHLVAG